MNLPAPARSRRIPQNKRRGFTLIEIAIAMMVIGVLLGATVTTMRALEERRQFKNEIRRMERIRDAVIGYALRNRTRARTIEFVPLYRDPVTFARFTLPSRVFHLPAGRPYLPCPDWDGDGYEDRSPEGQHGFRQGIEVQPNLAITATITKGRNPRGNHPHLFWIRFLSGSSYVPSQPHGNCVVSRGAVPWRTLGVHPADHWGNRHTYYADPVFSNAIFGFDRQTIADILDRRVPESPGYFRSPRIESRAEYARAADGRGAVASASRCPAVICDGIRAGNCWQHEFFRNSFAEIPYCTWGTAPPAAPNSPLAPYASLVLKAGAATKEAMHNGRETFPPGSVTDGLPFVLVSHGPNGNYAVNHWATLQNPTDENGNRTPVCNWGNSEDSLVVSPDDRGRIHEAVNGSRVAPAQFYPPLPAERCPQINRFNFNPSFFVWEPPGDEFDDLLMWMTREELTAKISDSIPKLPPMIVPYFDFD